MVHAPFAGQEAADEAAAQPGHGALVGGDIERDAPGHSPRSIQAATGSPHGTTIPNPPPGPRPPTRSSTASPHISNELAPAGQIVIAAAFALVHSVNGLRLHQAAVYLERHTQFGDILRPLKGSAGVFLDSAQPVAHGVRVANEYLSRAAHRRIVVLPHPKRFEKHLPVLVGKIAKTVQRGADR